MATQPNEDDIERYELTAEEGWAMFGCSAATGGISSIGRGLPSRPDRHQLDFEPSTEYLSGIRGVIAFRRAPARAPKEGGR